MSIREKIKSVCNSWKEVFAVVIGVLTLLVAVLALLHDIHVDSQKPGLEPRKFETAQVEEVTPPAQVSIHSVVIQAPEEREGEAAPVIVDDQENREIEDKPATAVLASVMIKGEMKLMTESSAVSAALCTLKPSDYIVPQEKEGAWCRVQVSDSQQCREGMEGYLPLFLINDCGPN